MFSYPKTFVCPLIKEKDSIGIQVFIHPLLVKPLTQVTSVLNCVRLLTRLIPFVFESEEWRSFFWSKNSIDLEDSLHGEGCGNAPLAQILLKKLSVSDLISHHSTG